MCRFLFTFYEMLSLQDDYDQGFDVNNEMANRMSLFYAHATPLMKMLSDATTKFVTEVGILSLKIFLFCVCSWYN